MVIFHSYVSLPEGNYKSVYRSLQVQAGVVWFWVSWWNMVKQLQLDTWYTQDPIWHLGFCLGTWVYHGVSILRYSASSYLQLVAEPGRRSCDFPSFNRYHATRFQWLCQWNSTCKFFNRAISNQQIDHDFPWLPHIFMVKSSFSHILFHISMAILAEACSIPRAGSGRDLRWKIQTRCLSLQPLGRVWCVVSHE